MRKWSGHEVPSCASRGAASWARKSRTTGESSKCPTTGRSPPAMHARDRTETRRLHGVGRRRRARRPARAHRTARRDRARRGTRSARATSSSVVASHSSLVAPQQMSPCPPSRMPRAPRMRRCVRSYCEPELEARTTPVEPPHVVAVAVAHEALTVGRGRQRDHCVGMGVVDVVGVEQRVEWSVDRRGAPPIPKRHAS